MTDHPPPATDFWANRRVMITGHTGFKGSWLACWLRMLGAEVCGYALEPPTRPSHFDLLKLDIDSKTGDIRNPSEIKKCVSSRKPEIVFHLAAQPLVRESYADPGTTFETNVMGTLNVYEACRSSSSVRAIVNVTSDKCYENLESDHAYNENDRIGGHDPYSASKGCSELLTASYRKSFFNPEKYGFTHNILLASARAGNVIGGGDWAADRLIPDLMRGASKNKEIVIRNPKSTRPWQHVLESLAGYLALGQKLLDGNADFAGAWNFGPDNDETLTVQQVTNEIKSLWNKIKFSVSHDPNAPHEATFLKLDSSKAREKLLWHPLWNSSHAIKKTAEWYQNYYENNQLNTLKDIEEYGDR